jgi:hypothetical protein
LRKIFCGLREQLSDLCVVPHTRYH